MDFEDNIPVGTRALRAGWFDDYRPDDDEDAWEDGIDMDDTEDWDW